LKNLLITSLYFGCVCLYSCYSNPTNLPVATPVQAQLSVDYTNFLCSVDSPGAVTQNGKGQCNYRVVSNDYQYHYMVLYSAQNITAPSASTFWLPLTNLTQVGNLAINIGSIPNQDNDVLTFSVPSYGSYNFNFRFNEWGVNGPVPANVYGNTATCLNPTITYYNPDTHTTSQVTSCNKYGRTLSFAGGFIPTSSLHVVMNTYNDPNNTFSASCYDCCS